MAFFIRTNLRLIPRIPSRPIIAGAASLRLISSSTSAAAAAASAGGGEHRSSKYRLRLGIPVICSIIAAASFHSYSSTGSGELWNAKYRDYLGIGDSPVVLRATELWEPPQHGVVKINYTVSQLTLGNKDMADQKSTGEDVESVCTTFDALARNSSGGIIGHAGGSMRNPRNRMEFHLYALRGIGNLMLALRLQGFHDGPFVIESDTDFEEIVKCLALDDSYCSDDYEPLLRYSMPDEPEVIDTNTKIMVGDPEEMMKVLEGGSSEHAGVAGLVMLQNKKFIFLVHRTKSGVDAGGT